MEAHNTLSTEKREELLRILKDRFENNMNRHKGLEWASVHSRLNASPSRLKSLYAMEQTGGEPDVVDYDRENDRYVFFDCSPESPEGRRNLCYDRQALDSRKTARPKDSAMDMAAAMGIGMLTEEQYSQLQNLGSFDTRTSSWLKTPPEIRNLGGALFGDRRYGQVFLYHNGASSYYSSRGFRGFLTVGTSSINQLPRPESRHLTLSTSIRR